MSVTGIEAGGELIETSQRTFERLLRPHLRQLHRLAYHLTGGAQDAEDLLQDVLMKLFQRTDELSSIVDLAPWISRVMYNLYIDQRRRSRTRRFNFTQPRVGELPEEDELHRVPSPAPGPEDDASVQLDIRRVDRALVALSDEHRIVVLLHDGEEYTMEEIASITGVPVGTVKSRLHRARDRLRQLL